MGIPVPSVGYGGSKRRVFGSLVGVNHTMGVDWVLKDGSSLSAAWATCGSIAAAIFISLLEAYAAIWADQPGAGRDCLLHRVDCDAALSSHRLFVPTPK